MLDLDHPSIGRAEADASVRRQVILRMSLLALIAFLTARWTPTGVSDEFDGALTALVRAMERAVPGTRAVLSTVDHLTLFQGVPLVALACAGFATAATDRRRAGLIVGCAGVGTAYCLSGALILLAPSIGSSISRAILLVGLASAILLIDRRIGRIAAAVAALGVVARLSGGGLATDLLAGGLLGVAAAGLSVAAAVAWAERWLRQLRGVTPLVAVFAVMAASQLANAFDDLQMIGASLSKHLRAGPPAVPRESD